MSSALISLNPHSHSSLIHRAILFCNLDYLHRQTLIFHSDLAESSVDPILAVAKILANSLVEEFKNPLTHSSSVRGERIHYLILLWDC